MNRVSYYNRFFRDSLDINGLCLLAKALKFDHPTENKTILVQSPQPDKWKKLELLFSQNTVT